MKRAWGIALGAAVLIALVSWTHHREDGLVRTAALQNAGRDTIHRSEVRSIDLQNLDGILGHPEGITLRWEGFWNAPSAGLYDLSLESRGASSWKIDGHVALEVEASTTGAARAVWLESGFHQIDVAYQPAASPQLVVAAAKAGESLAPLDVRTLKPRLPRNPRLRSAANGLSYVLRWVVLVALVVAIRRTIPVLVNRWRQPTARGAAVLARLARPFAWTAVVLVVGYGALLRLDAITAQYGPVTSPGWLAAVQTRTIAAPAAIRPSGFAWTAAPLFPHADGPPTRYRSDPYTYLEIAREPRSFYTANYREPVFPFATKVFLYLLDGQDVAVSFASTAFAVFAIWLTYILGAAVWSRPVGLVAALGLAINYDAISLASAGWRDDAFVAVTVLCASLVLRCWRAGREPARTLHIGRLKVDAALVDAVMLGVAAGLACLVRIFAVSFIVPAAMVLLFTMRVDWRRRLTMTGLAVVTAAIVAGPYFVNCWRVYGDPLFAFNVHGNVYRVAEGQAESSQGTAAYIMSKAALRPLETIDTVAVGLTTYPFSNKWHGLSVWRPWIGRWSAIAAVVGLMILAATSRGRLLLIVLLTSLVPFAFSWKVDANWRFTAHAYPFFLIAAGVALGGAAWCARTLIGPRRGPIRIQDRSDRPRRPLLTWSMIGLAAVVGFWLIARALPRWVFTEAVRIRDGGVVMAGVRDEAFFGRGWSSVLGGGNVTTRVATAEGTLSIPLPGIDDYRLTMRLEPFPRPLHAAPSRLPAIEVVLNGTTIGRVSLQWNPERVGTYDFVLPRTVVRRGENRVLLRVARVPPSDGVSAIQPGLTDGDAIALWYLRVHPGLTGRAGLGESNR